MAVRSLPLASKLSWARFSSVTGGDGAAVGFIGLGNMGARMAERLADAGHRLTVFDVNKAAVERAESRGTGVFSASGGVRSPLLIDCSTIDPATARAVSASAQAAPLHADSASLADNVRAPLMIDAPVSGGVSGASAGTLTFMCGGTEAAIDAAEPFFSAMGKRVVRCGQAGNGQAAKLCNNLVLAIQMAGVSEGLAMGRRLGLDPNLLTDIFNSSTASCWSSHTNNPCPGVMEGVPSSRDYEGGFGSSLMLKDLGLAMAAAQQCESPVPVGSLVEQLYRVVLEQEGAGRQDFSSIFRHVYGEGLPGTCKDGESSAEGKSWTSWQPGTVQS